MTKLKFLTLNTGKNFPYFIYFPCIAQRCIDLVSIVLKFRIGAGIIGFVRKFIGRGNTDGFAVIKNAAGKQSGTQEKTERKVK